MREAAIAGVTNHDYPLDQEQLEFFKELTGLAIQTDRCF